MQSPEKFISIAGHTPGPLKIHDSFMKKWPKENIMVCHKNMPLPVKFQRGYLPSWQRNIQTRESRLFSFPRQRPWGFDFMREVLRLLFHHLRRPRPQPQKDKTPATKISRLHWRHFARWSNEPFSHREANLFPSLSERS